MITIGSSKQYKSTASEDPYTYEITFYDLGHTSHRNINHKSNYKL